MRKFNWKALLIVVMAVVMVFALVACNKDNQGGGSNPGDNTPSKKITSAEYFTQIWDVAAGIGDEEIPDDKNIYIGAEFEITLGSREYITAKAEDNKSYYVAGYKNEQGTSLDLKLQIILDRNSANSENTVLKASLGSGAQEIVGLYYALKNPDDIYVDFAGQHILFPLHFDITLKEGGKDVTYSNSTLGTLLKGALGKEFKINNTPLTLDSLLKAMTKDMGEDWSIDNLVNAILPVVGLDLDSLLSNLDDMGLGKLISEFKDEEGNLSIKKALNSGIVENVLQLSARQQGNKYMLTMGPMIPSMIGDAICSNDITPSLTINFEKDGNAFKDGLTINLDIEGSDFRVDNTHPFLAVKIKDLEFGNADKHELAVNTQNYTENAQFEIKESFSAKGVKFNGEALQNIEFGAKFKLDLKKADAKTNGTQANVYLKYGDKNIVEASYIGGTLALKVDQTANIGGFGLKEIFPYFGEMLYGGLKQFLFQGQDTPMLKTLENAIYADATGGGKDHSKLNEKFTGVAITGIDPVKLYDMALNAIAAQIQNLLPPAAPSGSGETSAETTEPATPTFQIKSIGDLIYLIIERGVKTFGDGKFVLGSDDILQFVCDFANTMYNLPQKGLDKWNVTSCKQQLKAMIVSMIQPPKEFEGTPEQYLERELEEVFTGEDANYIHFAIDGVDFSKKGTSTYLDYLISALLDKLSATFTFDCSGNKGITWSLEAKAAGATLKYDSVITATTNPAKQADLAEGITKDNAAEKGWAYLDISAMFATHEQE